MACEWPRIYITHVTVVVGIPCLLLLDISLTNDYRLRSTDGPNMNANGPSAAGFRLAVFQAGGIVMIDGFSRLIPISGATRRRYASEGPNGSSPLRAWSVAQHRADVS